jgi:hypothetical protein
VNQRSDPFRSASRVEQKACQRAQHGEQDQPSGVWLDGNRNIEGRHEQQYTAQSAPGWLA